MTVLKSRFGKKLIKHGNNELRRRRTAGEADSMGTERLEQLLAERLAPDSALLQALMKVVLSTAGSVEK